MQAVSQVSAAWAGHAAEGIAYVDRRLAIALEELAPVRKHVYLQPLINLDFISPN